MLNKTKQHDHGFIIHPYVCSVCRCTHMASFGLVELLLMSVLQHAVHHPAALPHIKQRLPMLVSHLLQPQSGRISVTFKASR